MLAADQRVCSKPSRSLERWSAWHAPKRWCHQADSNCRRPPLQGGALPTELQWHEVSMRSHMLRTSTERRARLAIDCRRESNPLIPRHRSSRHRLGLRPIEPSRDLSVELGVVTGRCGVTCREQASFAPRRPPLAVGRLSIVIRVAPGSRQIGHRLAKPHRRTPYSYEGVAYSGASSGLEPARTMRINAESNRLGGFPHMPKHICHQRDPPASDALVKWPAPAVRPMLAPLAGFEPTAGPLGKGCSIQGELQRRDSSRERRRKMVPHTGFEPVVSAVRGRCPGPLDECGKVFSTRRGVVP